jgi:hypothetical protein
LGLRSEPYLRAMVSKLSRYNACAASPFPQNASSSGASSPRVAFRSVVRDFWVMPPPPTALHRFGSSRCSPRRLGRSLSPNYRVLQEHPKIRSSRLLKIVLERSGCARLIQHSGPWRTKDSAPRGPGFENCASLIPSRVFQQPARPCTHKRAMSAFGGKADIA